MEIKANDKITIGKYEYTVIVATDNSNRPNMLKEGFAVTFFASRKKSSRTYVAHLLTDGRFTKPVAL